MKSQHLESFPTKDLAESWRDIYARIIVKKGYTEEWGVTVKPVQDMWAVYVESYE